MKMKRMMVKILMMVRKRRSKAMMKRMTHSLRRAISPCNHIVSLSHINI